MRMQDTIRLTPTLVALAYLLVPPQTSAFKAAASEHRPVEAISSAPGAACGRNLPRQDDSEASEGHLRSFRSSRSSSCHAFW
jgi:hypothetical protein